MKFLTLLFSAFFLFAASAYCQNNDDPTMDVGFKPYGSYNGGDIDSVNLSNGFLNLHIPIIEYPQRGALSYSAQVIYNNHKGWSVFPDCINENTCHPIWQWKGSGVTVDTRSPDFFTAGPGPYVKGSKFIVYTGVTADGSSHQMAITPSGSAASIDGSGLWQNGTAFGAPGGFARNRSGFVNDGINLEDNNGNLLSFPTTTPAMTDTIGRNIPTTFSPGAADFSGCTGPLPTVSASIISFAGYKGATRSFKACFASIALQSNFNTTGFYNDMQLPIAEGHTTVAMLQSLVLYNGTSWTTSLAWTFEYNSHSPGDSTSVNYGDLTKITLPTGGTISYAWGFIGNCDPLGTTPLSRRVISRTVDANDGKGPQKWIYNGGIVTDPTNNDTVHTFTGLNFSCSLYETQTQYFQGSFQNGQILKTVTTDYQWMANPFDGLDGTATPPTVTNVFPIRITTTWPSGKVAKVEKDYDSSLVFTVPGRGQFTGSYGLVLETREYDYADNGSTPLLLRRTDYVYKAFDGSPTAGSFLSSNMLDRVSSVTTFDGTGNKVAQVKYGYDELVLQPSGVAVQHKSTPTNGATRGNITSQSRWLNTTNSYLTTKSSYYDTGTPYVVTDPGGHSQTNFYTSGFQSLQDFAGAYVTETQDALNHNVYLDYDLVTGLPTAVKDQNGGISTTGYDIYQRTLQKTAPNGASTLWAYTDSQPPSFVATSTITSSMNHVVEADLDGLGRAAHKKLVSDSAGQDIVDITYDGLGRVVTVSNPHRIASSATDGLTTTVYDALGRSESVLHQDGSVSKTDYSNFPVVTSTDAAGNVLRTRTNALGHTVETDQPGDPSSGVPASTTINISGLSLQSKTTSVPPTAGTGSITVSGTEQGKTISAPTCKPTQPCGAAVGTLLFDSGTVGITVNGHTDSVTFGAGSTVSDVANRLANAIHTNSPYVDYTKVVSNPATPPTPPSATIFLQARTGGTSTDYPLSYSWTFDSSDFKTSSYTTSTSGAFLTGGTDAPKVGIVTMDSGTVTVNIGSVTAHAAFGINASSTPVQLASALASALNSQSPPFTATAGANSVSIKWNSIGQSPNGTPMSASATWDSADFSAPSFSASGSPLANGGDPYPSGIDHPNTTLYTYDGLGNLTCVEQHGDLAGTGCNAPPASDPSSPWRVRRFTYDSLSRMLTSNTPEAGTISYSYDADGLLLSKTSPAPNQTGTATQTIGYCYDALHRITGKGYGPQSCPLTQANVTYSYDAGSNGVGRLTSQSDQMGAGQFSYDIMGRIITETRTLYGAATPNTDVSPIVKTASYEYNLNGSISKLHYPSGATVSYSVDSAGRVVSATDDGNTVNFVTDATYNPAGGITGFVNGKGQLFGGITNTFSYNNRLQPATIKATSTNGIVLSLGYDFHVGDGTAGSDNGDIFGILNYKDPQRNQTFAYDALDRLVSAHNAGSDCTSTVLEGKTEYWGNTYAYDSWGNLIIKSISKCGAENMSMTADTHNQMHSTSGVDNRYDAAGNMIYDGSSQTSYVYDAENRLSGVDGSAYFYDDSGHRVRKSTGTAAAQGTLYWHMTPGVLAETDLAGVTKSEYVYFNGVRVARRDGTSPTNPPVYYFSDFFKTATVVVDSNGVVKSESDFYPWGGEVKFSAGDSNNYKFAGQERDKESGLDLMSARFYANNSSRFISVDSTLLDPARIFNPQGFNAYSYALNNPLRYVDPTGRAPISAALVGRINDFTGTVHQAAMDRVSSVRNHENVIDSPEGSRLSGAAASAQIAFEQHFSDASDSFVLLNYNSAMSNLESFLMPGVEAGIDSTLESWVTDPNTTEENLWSAFGQIAVADMKNPPKPGEGNDQAKEVAVDAVKAALDELSDHACEYCSIGKKVFDVLLSTLPNPNHEARFNALRIILGGIDLKESQKKPSKQAAGQKCRETDDGGKTWGPCDY